MLWWDPQQQVREREPVGLAGEVARGVCTLSEGHASLKGFHVNGDLAKVIWMEGLEEEGASPVLFETEMGLGDKNWA